MELNEAMRTAFSAREFTRDPVSDATLARILDTARFAPSGGNRQGWHVIVVRDPAIRAALVPLIEPTYKRYLAEARAGANPFNTVEPAAVGQAEIDAVTVRPGYLEGLVNAPVLLLVTVDLSVVASMDRHLPRIGVISGASIYPFVWNILLAARNEGLGGTLTTFLAAEEAKAKALFGIPHSHALAAMLPIGKPVRQLTRLRRNPVAEFATLDAFNGEAFNG